MSQLQAVEIAGLILVVASLYSSIGHAGASGYLAVFGLFGLDEPTMRPAALILNLLVSVIGTVQFARAGHFRWRTFWPFALASMPFAFLGGRIHLDDLTYRRLVGAVLLFAAYRLAVIGRRDVDAETRPVPIWAGLICGGLIGLLSGLTGVGGGIFLTPLLLLANWAQIKEAAATSVAFILVNSAAGLAGLLSTGIDLPIWKYLAVWSAAAIVGGAIGSTLGSRRLPPLVLRRLLAAVLVIAAVNLLLPKIKPAAEATRFGNYQCRASSEKTAKNRP